MILRSTRQPDLIAADDPNAALCVAVPGMMHDYRPFERADHIYYRCVWCHVAACGDEYGDNFCGIPDAKHEGLHRAQNATLWNEESKKKVKP